MHKDFASESEEEFFKALIPDFRQSQMEAKKKLTTKTINKTMSQSKIEPIHEENDEDKYKKGGHTLYLSNKNLNQLDSDNTLQFTEQSFVRKVDQISQEDWL